MNVLTIGKWVWWDDPSGKGSGPYVVKEIWNDEEGLYDTTMIHISNNESEADVSAGELQDLEYRRKCISDFVAKVTDIAEEDDWQVHNYDEKFDKVDLDFCKYSSQGQDFSFNVGCKTGSVNEFLEAIENFYDDFDPSERASKWLGPDGHGINGAPYDLETLLNDMKECKNNMKHLINLFKKTLTTN